MRYNPAKHHRRSMRLKGYDYTQNGAYFVTIVVQNRTCLFGKVVDGIMQLNVAGQMIDREWHALPTRFPNVHLDAFVVMPNHIHGIIILTNAPPAGAPLVGAQNGVAPNGVAPTVPLGAVVGAYKSLTTVEFTRGVKTLGWPPFPGKLWQRNYHERIVRDDAALNRIRRYIEENPARWAADTENPVR